MIWGFLRAASWAQRGIFAGILAGIFAVGWGWGWLVGGNSCEQEHLKSIAAQSMQATKAEAVKSNALASVDEKHDAIARTNADNAKVVTHEIIRYVHDPKSIPCDLPAEYGRLIDRIDRLQHDAANRMPDTNPSQQETDELQARGITSHQLLLGYDAQSKARMKDIEMIEFAKEESQTRYEQEMSFYDKAHAVQMQAHEDRHKEDP